MTILDILVWSGILLALAAGVLLAVFANRRSTPEKPGTHWLIVPVVVLIIAAIILAWALSEDSLPALDD